MLAAFDIIYRVRHEEMKPIDSATFYYCFTKAGFKGDGQFYKHLQKTVSRTIRAFEGPELRLMFYKFDHLDESRLNRGVRGRLIEHCKYLIRERKLKGFDASDILKNTQTLPYEAPSTHLDPVVDMRAEREEVVDESGTQGRKEKLHELPFMLRNYLQKQRYFN